MKNFVTLPRVLLSILGGAILAFGLYNIHAPSGITEGGILGLVLLLDHHFSVSPSLSKWNCLLLRSNDLIDSFKAILIKSFMMMSLAISNASSNV